MCFAWQLFSCCVFPKQCKKARAWRMCLLCFTVEAVWKVCFLYLKKVLSLVEKIGPWCYVPSGPIGSGSGFFPGSSLQGADGKSQCYCDNTLYSLYIGCHFSHLFTSPSSCLSSGRSSFSTCNQDKVHCWQPSAMESRVSRWCSEVSY